MPTAPRNPAATLSIVVEDAQCGCTSNKYSTWLRGTVVPTEKKQKAFKNGRQWAPQPITLNLVARVMGDKGQGSYGVESLRLRLWRELRVSRRHVEQRSRNVLRTLASLSKI